MNLLMILVICAAVLALAFAAFNFFKVKKMPEGTGTDERDRLRDPRGRQCVYQL